MRSTELQELPGAALLRLARGSIEHGLRRGEPLPINVDQLQPALAEHAATFTTLRLDGELRGCCGMLEALHPLATDVTYSAFKAAFRDSRFNPLAEHEFDAIRLEVSVLTPLTPMAVADEADLLGQLSPGIDGLVIVDEGRRATFLPKVWESLPEPIQFLRQLKRKCGLDADYWSEHLEFHRYRTTSYGEPV